MSPSLRDRASIAAVRLQPDPRHRSTGFAITAAAISALTILASCATNATTATNRPAAASTASTAPPAPTIDHATAVATFDAVWEKVRDTHFDPNMNGVDWIAVR